MIWVPMIWVKAFHVVFMVTWFAGLLYLPRLFVYHAAAEEPVLHERFTVMERRLFTIMTIGGVATVVLGLWLLFAYAWAAYSQAMWLHIKLTLGLFLIAYHLFCFRVLRDFRHGRNRHGQVFYRWMNELPALALVAMVVLAVVKPF